MTFCLPEQWVWDFWTAQDGDDVHLFFLHAPRSLGDPDLRHAAARVGHAVTRDLRTWALLPEALEPSEGPRFDDRAVWTGSVIQHGDGWLMFYTGISRADPGPVQRIGMATSNDLVTWQRTPVCIEADPTWYEKAGAVSAQEHWRDPWALRTSDGAIHLLVTARTAAGPVDERAVIGHVWSRDLVRWTVEPPLSGPGAFRQLEVPQVVEVDGRWHLLVSVGAGDYAARRRATHGFVASSGTLSVPADAPLGPFETAAARPLVADARGSLYGARVIRWRGALKVLAWRRVGPDGKFLGGLTDPMDVRVEDAGYLEIGPHQVHTLTGRYREPST